MSNNRMVLELEDTVPHFDGQMACARCFLHVGNLISKSLVKAFDLPSKESVNFDGTRDGIEEDDELERLAGGLEAENWQTITENGEDPTDTDDTEGWIRKLAFKIIHLTTIVLPAWDAACADHSLKQRRMLRNVLTCWNSALDMLDFGVLYKQAIKTVTDKCKLGLAKFAIDEHEWELLKQLCNVLKVLKDAMLFLSHSTPNLVMVIPVMDYINEVFTNRTLQWTNLDPVIHAALSMAKKTLNRYYSLTDSSDLYHIAMVLHPWHKLVYFRSVGWEPDWINMAHELVRNTFDSSYAACTAPPTEDLVSDQLKTNHIHNELDTYLTSNVEDISDALKWWHEHRSTYLCLLWMALNYLTIPATSIDVECLFSKGHILIPHLHNRLSIQSIRALLCLGSWSVLGYVKNNDVKQVVSHDGGADEEAADAEL
ncbi:hypothetical protein SCLCIDRAFT_22590 [Scleroderma citrinum Foug A]|uniref:HAT C-terminal dimerisation domain-containing protein n=1 Tax=Scleroderma citrinum Foug A TaxID=1036808 RepID=A0A0C3AL97_9AGAM|nr:hypothetical protein SCLCIDRAFT_22590 [Scleroderma citrinum Foug A]